MSLVNMALLCRIVTVSHLVPGKWDFVLGDEDMGELPGATAKAMHTSLAGGLSKTSRGNASALQTEEAKA